MFNIDISKIYAHKLKRIFMQIIKINRKIINHGTEYIKMYVEIPCIKKYSTYFIAFLKA